ncbi:MAG TPA: PadR family transcriptional regulator [Vicinamibacterales bacterium]|nr:PadR family transcriptional regulator [Vicinamibacterales bacterium]
MGGRQSYLGEFEQVVLLAVARLKAEAYGMGVRSEIVERTGREVTVGAMYATLDRLVAKGYLRSRDEAQDGRPKRFFAITATGVDALEAARELQARMWAGLRLPKGGPR